MEWLKPLAGKVVGLDAAPLIYFQVVPVSPEIAETASRLRAIHKIPTPDAIHLPTAIRCGADYFFTNDKDMPAALSSLATIILWEPL